jgi:CheY-like chemotaxis protein
VNPGTSSALTGHTPHLERPRALVPRLQPALAIEGRALRLRAVMHRKKILLVDDSIIVLLMERMILSRSEYDFVTAKDGIGCLEKACAEHPDLILMDAVMPRMDGFEACRQLRTREETASIPVIMVITRGDLASVERGYASGCNDYLTKPINGLELLAKVRSYLG